MRPEASFISYVMRELLRFAWPRNTMYFLPIRSMCTLHNKIRKYKIWIHTHYAIFVGTRNEAAYFTDMKTHDDLIVRWSLVYFLVTSSHMHPIFVKLTPRTTKPAFYPGKIKTHPRSSYTSIYHPRPAIKTCTRIRATLQSRQPPKKTLRSALERKLPPRRERDIYPENSEKNPGQLAASSPLAAEKGLKSERKTARPRYFTRARPKLAERLISAVIMKFPRGREESFVKVRDETMGKEEEEI